MKQKTFKWTGINTLGKKINGEIQSLNKSDALLQLKNQNILFIHLSSKKNIFSKKISAATVVFFFRQLATLITAGVPIVQSLLLLYKMNTYPIFQKMMTTIKNDLESGKLLSVSLRQFPQYFDVITCQLIHVGEQSGTLATILTRIAHHKEKMMHLKKKMIQSLMYPAIILSTAIMVTGIMLAFVVPRFAELFKTMHGTLPTLTLAVITLSRIIQQDSWLLLLLGIFSLLLLKYVTRLPAGKQRIDRFILTIPLVGHIFSKIILARFSRYLTITLSAGIPMTQSLNMITHITGNLFYQKIIFCLYLDLSKGQQLHQSMQKHSAFPLMMIQMIKIGEESGTLEAMLEKISDIYESDIEHLITHMTNTLEPLIMIILGVLIGGLVIAMYLPIFKLGTLM